MNVLLTGGAGFIGSHMAAKLLNCNINFLVVDNLSNSNRSQLKRLEGHFLKKIPFYNSDIRDKKKMTKIFKENQIDSVIHLAGLKSVNESVNNPQHYYDNNVVGSKTLLSLAKENNIKRFIFSSSATVYGEPKYLPIDEEHPLSAMSPYGQNKIDIESSIINDPFFNVDCCTKILRYFNPVGAFENGLIGEIPRGIPNNLMPYLLGVVNKDYPFFQVFGSNYKTIDGTPVRDYIHIMDLIDAHYHSLQDNKYGIEIFNVGTGEGYSVMQILKAFEQINKIKIPYKIMPRREGDVETCYADNKKIFKRLNWKSTRDIYQICQDTYKFSQKY